MWFQKAFRRRIFIIFMNLTSQSARLFAVCLLTLLSTGSSFQFPSSLKEESAFQLVTPAKNRSIESVPLVKKQLTSNKLKIDTQKITKMVKELQNLSNSQEFCGTACSPLYREYKDLMRTYQVITDNHIKAQYDSSAQLKIVNNKHKNMLTSVTLQISERMANCQGTVKKKKINNQIQLNRQKDPLTNEQRYFIKVHKILTEQKSINKRIEKQRGKTDLDEAQLNACFKNFQTLRRNIDAFIKEVKLKLPSFLRKFINRNIIDKCKKEIEQSLVKLKENMDKIEKNKRRIRREINKSEQIILDILDKTENIQSLNRIQLQKLLKEVSTRKKQISQSLSNIEKSNLVTLELKNHFKQKNNGFLKSIESIRLQLQRLLTQKPEYDSLELAKQSPKDLFIAKKVECKSMRDYSEQLDELYGSYQKLLGKTGSTAEEWIESLLSLYKYENRFLNFYAQELKRISKVKIRNSSQVDKLNQIELKIDSLRVNLFERLREKQIAKELIDLVQKYITLDKQFDTFISSIYLNRPKSQQEKDIRAETIRLRKLFGDFKSQTQATVCKAQMCRILKTNQEKLAIKMLKTANFVLQLFSPIPQRPFIQYEEQQFDRRVFSDPRKQFIPLALLSRSDSPLKKLYVDSRSRK